MSLREAYTAVRIIETSDNYARADKPLVTAFPQEVAGGDIDDYYDDYYDDEYFWQTRLADPTKAWGREVRFYTAALSEWVARVPGLFWTEEARKLRELAEAQISYVSAGWRVYHPPGKSDKVMGGIGTFRLPPAVDGTRLVTFTTTVNASAGVPALISADVWDKIGRSGPHEGQVLDGTARWQPMEDGWAARFRSTRGVPRGYLIVNDPDAVRLWKEQAPIQFHPFTVMEYYSGSKELFDYVYATGDTGDARHRQDLIKFFDSYKDEQDRHGRYLLAGDMVDALWDADYDTPADLRHADPSAESQLDLLEARVRASMLGHAQLDTVLEVLGRTTESVDDVRRHSLDIGMRPGLWLRGGTMAEVCSQFLAEVVKQDKLEELVEKLAAEYPHLMT